MKFLSAFICDPAEAGRIALRVFADVDGKRFEFVRLRPGHWSLRPEVEVYDFPKAWGGVPRFLGYLPESTGDKLYAMAREFARAVNPFRSFGTFEAERPATARAS